MTDITPSIDPREELRRERQDRIHALINRIPKQNQRQDSTLDQLLDLIPIANRCGLYDASDYLRQQVEVWQKRATDAENRANPIELRAYRRAGGEPLSSDLEGDD